MEGAGWISVLEKDIAPWVVVLPQSNQIKLNQIEVFLCQYISKVMQVYKYSSGYKVNTNAKWKMANFFPFLS